MNKVIIDSNTIPILIICYNNYKFIKNIVNQIEKLIISPNIILIDNKSTCKYTIDYIYEIEKKYTDLIGDLELNRVELILKNFHSKLLVQPGLFEHLSE